MSNLKIHLLLKLSFSLDMFLKENIVIKLYCGGKNMNKYPLIGVSILSVVLLVLASLSNVVGYQSVKSTAVNDSPLFSLRTHRATNRQQNLIMSQYLGKGKENQLEFPPRNNKTEIFQKFIMFTRNMDKKTFEQLIELSFNKIRQSNIIEKTNIDYIKLILFELKTNPDIIKNYFFNENNNNITSSEFITICNWVQGCIIIHITTFFLEISVFIALFIFVFVGNFIHPTFFTCHQKSYCVCVH